MPPLEPTDMPTLPTAARSPRVPFLRRALAGGLALALAACGGGGGGSGGGGDTPPPAAVVVATTSLPPAAPQVPYATTLRASGGTPPYAWALASGSTLPPGLGLSSAGVLSGTPTSAGSFTFTILVTDAGSPADQASATYALTISTFDASISLLRFGEAWTGESYPLSALGGPGTTFALLQGPSGGRIADASPSTSTATYVAGNATGTDRIRATSATGATEDIDVVVRTNPAANMTGRFATTDVWHLRFEGRKDASHAFTSDWHAALARAGLRGANSTSTYGTTADEIADTYVRVQTLRFLNEFYGNATDGAAKTGSLAISFPLDEPDVPYTPVPDGQVRAPAVDQYNVISVLAGSDAGVIGTAYLDDTSNGAQENDTTTGTSGSLGVFCDELVTYFNIGYSNSTLPAAPVGSSDEAALKALLYGASSPGGRYTELRRIGEGLARTLAAVAAHEIGHSLGLTHTSPSVSGSLMNASTTIGPQASYTFIASDWTILTGGLPGPGRGSSAWRVESLVQGPEQTVPGVTVVTCGCKTHE